MAESRNLRACVCVVCSSGFYEDERTKDRGSLNLTNILKLIVRKSPLSRCQRRGDGGGGDSSREEYFEDGGVQFFEETLKDLENQKVSVCPPCSDLTFGALEARSRAEEVEVEVGILQRQLLKLLRKLKEEMENFNQEMRKIEMVIKESCKGDGLKEFVESRNRVEGEVERKVELVRERILDVVTDLRFFQSDLNDKLIVSRTEDEEDYYEETRSFEMPLAEVNFVPETEAEVEVVTCDAGVMEDPLGVDEAEDEVGMEYARYIGHYILGGDNSENNEDEDGLANNRSCNGDIYNGRLNSPRKKAKLKLAKFKSVNLSRMTGFKRGLIKRAMEREMKRKQEDDLHENPLIKYYLRFDPTTDSFFVGDVQIQVSDSTKDRPEESKLECTGVGCTTSWSPPQNNEHTTTFDRDIRNHVIGKHLGGFSCRVCTLSLDSYFKLMTHFKKNHPGQKPLNDNSMEGGGGGADKAKSDYQQYLQQSPSRSTPRASTISNSIHSKEAATSRNQSRFRSLDKFRKRVPKRISKRTSHQSAVDDDIRVPLSPSEGLKQVRMSLKSAIESLGERQSQQQPVISPIAHPPPSLDRFLLDEQPIKKPKKRNQKCKLK